MFTRDSVMGQVGCLEKAVPPPIPTASSSAEYGGPEPGFLGEAGPKTSEYFQLIPGFNTLNSPGNLSTYTPFSL